MAEYRRPPVASVGLMEPPAGFMEPVKSGGASIVIGLLAGLGRCSTPEC